MPTLFDKSFRPDEIDELSRNRPLVLLLGNVDHEGITHSLKASSTQYKKKLLASKPYNWRKIVALFDLFTIQAVVIKLNADVYRLLLDPSYLAVREELLRRISASRHIVFVYEDLLSTPANPNPETFAGKDSHKSVPRGFRQG